MIVRKAAISLRHTLDIKTRVDSNFEKEKTYGE